MFTKALNSRALTIVAVALALTLSGGPASAKKKRIFSVEALYKALKSKLSDVVPERIENDDDDVWPLVSGPRATGCREKRRRERGDEHGCRCSGERPAPALWSPGRVHLFFSLRYSPTCRVRSLSLFL